ncbi:peroxisomal membrane protein 11A isoform X1 [Echeneis naucrates]|uniref:Peroxisomal biogenesis factor 11 alpha n=1 Tax=Echeneis naucrates TaxID=173247 RepID=A0A665UVN5_ECHNA|nr:peroxisomal membrane protein 11A isoform X1 [Echeneis naucrates]
MNAIVQFTSQSQGRDRIFRAAQYACALSSYLLRNSGRESHVAKLKGLEANMSAGRKLLRLGNTINSIEAAKRTMQLSDRVLSLCLTVANVNRALYFICDNALWVKSVGLSQSINKERWSLNAYRFYFLSLVMNLTRDIYVVVQLMRQSAKDKNFRQKMDRHLSESPEVAEAVVPQLDAFVFLLFESLKSNPAVALDTLKNICDLFIPLDRLSIYPSNAGVVGFCGLISSLIGIVTLAQPKLRMKP